MEKIVYQTEEGAPEVTYVTQKHDPNLYPPIKRNVTFDNLPPLVGSAFEQKVVPTDSMTDLLNLHPLYLKFKQQKRNPTALVTYEKEQNVTIEEIIYNQNQDLKRALSQKQDIALSAEDLKEIKEIISLKSIPFEREPNVCYDEIAENAENLIKEVKQKPWTEPSKIHNPEGTKPEGIKHEQVEGAKPEGAKPEGTKPEGTKPEGANYTTDPSVIFASIDDYKTDFNTSRQKYIQDARHEEGAHIPTPINPVVMPNTRWIGNINDIVSNARNQSVPELHPYEEKEDSDLARAIQESLRDPNDFTTRPAIRKMDPSFIQTPNRQEGSMTFIRDIIESAENKRSRHEEDNPPKKIDSDINYAMFTNKQFIDLCKKYAVDYEKYAKSLKD